jgi:hypothetical protein
VFEMPPGKSLITIRPFVLAGTKYQGFERQIFATAGEELDLGLVRLTPMRSLRLRIKGPGVIAKVNGDPYSVRNGELSLELPEGNIDLEISASNGKTLRRSLKLQNDDVTMEASLE